MGRLVGGLEHGDDAIRLAAAEGVRALGRDDLAAFARERIEREPREAIRVRDYSLATEKQYVYWYRQFVRFLLPSMKFSFKSTFRLASLGGRYQWGAVRLTEAHYALADGAQDWKLIVGKINAHVSVAVLEGSTAPFARALAEDLDLECVERLAALRDPGQVDPAERNLLAAVVSARLQARRAMMDVQDHEPQTPTRQAKR